MRQPLTISVFTLLSLTLAACNSSPGEPDTGADIKIEKVSTDSQTVVSGAPIATTIRVKKGGKPLPKASVRFKIVSGAGNLSDTTITTDHRGEATTLWFLGFPAGEQKLEATVQNATVAFTATATSPEPGKTYFGRNNYIEYQPGTLPVILSAPHGGSLKPGELPDRTYGVTGADSNTEDLTRRTADALEEITGQRPHLVIVRLHRSKLDANREIVEAAQGNALAERAWNEYHLWIETARKIVEQAHGRGFYIDMHGHGHEIPRLELGYLLTSSDLAQPDAYLDQAGYINKSSVRTLATESDISFPELIRGPNSFGDMLVRRGYPSVPSSSDPHPDGAPYFNGGYSTIRHGSRGGGRIDGVQIEHHSAGVRNSAANRAAYASALAEAIVEFMGFHMGIELAK